MKLIRSVPVYGEMQGRNGYTSLRTIEVWRDGDTVRLCAYSRRPRLGRHTAVLEFRAFSDAPALNDAIIQALGAEPEQRTYGAYPCCRLLPGDRIVDRHKRSQVARELNGQVQLVVEHRVTGEPMEGKHLLVLHGGGPSGGVIWGDEFESAPGEP